uniref:dolichyl-phosphate-mannose--protein mannosyltransferase n=4 Tax=Cacopsylla melanoneura TaxID=428564 RepID=A0A8D8VDP2_9HEMI
MIKAREICLSAGSGFSTVYFSHYDGRRTHGNMSRRVVYASIVVIAVGVYFNSLHGDLVHDDLVAVARNPDVLGATSVRQMFTNDFWGAPLSDPASHKSYRPLTTLTFRLTNRLFGLEPVWFHACNMLLHALSCVLFTRLSYAVAGLSQKFAALAGILFAVHPIHSDAVTSIVGRADVLACVLFLLSFLFYHDSSFKAQFSSRLTISIVFALLSMLAKETGITVLVVNMMYDLYKHYSSIKRALYELRWNEEALSFAWRIAKTLVAMSLLLVFRLAMLQGSLPKFSALDNPAAFHPVFLVRFLTFSYLAFFNFWLLLCPSTLSHDWQMGSIPLVTNLADARNLATCAFFGCCLLLLYRCLSDLDTQRQCPLILGVLLLVIPFIPASNILVTVGFVVAERVLYIPSLGFILLISHGMQILFHSGQLRRRVLIGLLLVLVVSHSMKTIQRNNDWSSRESLARAGLQSLPDNAKMHYNFANFLHSQNQTETAIYHYRRALSLWPQYASAHNNLGTLLVFHEAEFHFKEAIRILPTHVNAHYNLGTIYSKMNRTREAISMAEKSIQLDRNYVPSYLLLAKLSDSVRRNQLLYYVTKLVRGPTYLVFYADYLLINHRSWQAFLFYSKALELQSNHLLSWLGLAKSLRSMGQKSRLHQILIRWHIESSLSRTSLVYSGDLYLRGHQVRSPPSPTSERSPGPHFNCNRNDLSKDINPLEEKRLCFQHSSQRNKAPPIYNRHHQATPIYSETPIDPRTHFIQQK